MDYAGATMTEPNADTHSTAVSGKKVIGIFIILFAMVAVPLTWWFHGGAGGIHDSPPMETPEPVPETQESRISDDVDAGVKPDPEKACEKGDEESCQGLDGTGEP